MEGERASSEEVEEACRLGREEEEEQVPSVLPRLALVPRSAVDLAEFRPAARDRREYSKLQNKLA
jgi:hypothetical protein